MPQRKLPDDAFAFYVGLGVGRSYASVAQEYGVAKRTVCERARKERWQERAEAMELEARNAIEKRARESLEAMNERHLRAARLLQGKAIEAISSMALEKQADMIRALDLGWRQERLVRGEPSERTQISVEEIVRREYSRWLNVESENGNGDGDTQEIEQRRLLSQIILGSIAPSERRLRSIAAIPDWAEQQARWRG